MNSTVQSRVTQKLKDDAERVFQALGLKTSDAIRMFLQQSVNVGGLPFRPTVAQPNADTRQAMEETRSGENLSTYDTFEDLRKELDV
jgi:DNA-damage-inducible protein J